MAWAGLLTLEERDRARVLQVDLRPAVAANASFAEALLAAHAEGFPDAPAASRTRATAAVQQALDWLERQELPEEAPDTGWGAWIVDALRGDPTAEMSDELAGILTGVDEVVEPGVGLGRYLGQVQPLARDQAATQAGGVRFMSMNMSKGLTVEAAIVVAAEEGVIPRPDADVAEERRLLYVAMTRARRFHFVTWARRRTGPTARAGAPNVRERRTETRFLRNGPVRTQDGQPYIDDRWGPLDEVA